MRPNEFTEHILRERFHGNTLIALATVENGKPHVREVDGNYCSGCFYVVTNRKSRKMQQIEKESAVAVCGEWFSGTGEGENLGHIGTKENLLLKEKLQLEDSAWYKMGRVDENDPDTCILCIRLREASFFAEGKRFDIVF